MSAFLRRQLLIQNHIAIYINKIFFLSTSFEVTQDCIFFGFIKLQQRLRLQRLAKNFSTCLNLKMSFYITHLFFSFFKKYTTHAVSVLEIKSNFLFNNREINRKKETRTISSKMFSIK